MLAHADRADSLSFTYYDSPIGPLLAAGDADALHVLAFPAGSRARKPEADWHEDSTPFAPCFEQLDAYFAGRLRRFDLPLAPAGTAFQQSVWAQLLEIPYAETISYGTLANRIGNKRASRAVGAANGANPIPIIIPCHRVIGSDRSLTGFGGGINLKRWLLNHEIDNAPETGAQGRLF